MRVCVWKDGVATAAAAASGPVFCAMGRQRTRNAVARAMQGGAALVLVDHGLAPCVHDLVPASRLRVVSDVRRAYARLSALEFGQPSRALQVIGVTGTNGKSSVAALLHWVLNQTGRPAGLIGTVRVCTGRREEPGALTTPDAYDLARYLAEMEDSGLTHAVMEVSSHGLDQRRTDGTHFRAAIFTNLAADHLDYHPDLQAYAQAKRRLFEQLGPSSIAILNAGDPASDYMALGTRSPIIWYGTSPASLVRGWWNGPDAVVTAPGFKGSAPLPGLGAHRLVNVLAVIAAAHALFVPAAEAWEAVCRYPGLWRRLQIIEGPDPVLVIDDCAHNPSNLRAAVAAVRPLVHPGRSLHVLYAVRGSRGVEVNRLNAEALAEAVDAATRVWLTNAADLAGAADRVLPEEAAVYHEAFRAGKVPYQFAPTAAEAMHHIKGDVHPGDVVLLLGAHAMDRAAALWRAVPATPCGGGIAGAGHTVRQRESVAASERGWIPGV